MEELLVPATHLGHGWVFAWRGWVPGIVILPAVVIALPSPGHVSDVGTADSARDLVAWTLVGCGGLMRLCAMIIGGRKDDELVTTGPYVLCRNPLYLGSGLVLLALCVQEHGRHHRRPCGRVHPYRGRRAVRGVAPARHFRRAVRFLLPPGSSLHPEMAKPGALRCRPGQGRPSAAGVPPVPRRGGHCAGS